MHDFKGFDPAPTNQDNLFDEARILGMTGGRFSRVLNLTTEDITFEDGTVLPTCGKLAQVVWQDGYTEMGEIHFVHRTALLVESMIARLDKLLADDTLGLVTLPVAQTTRGTCLEGRVASPIMARKGRGLPTTMSLKKFAV